MKILRALVPVALVPLLLTVAAYAADVSLGVHAGLSIPNIRGNADDVLSQGFSSRQGPFFGIFLETRVSPLFSLVADVNYTSQGGKRDGMQPITMDMGLPPLPDGMYYYADFHNETILNYLEFPVQARLTFGTKWRFFLNAGPYVGILLNAKAVTSGSSDIFLDAEGTQPITPGPVPFDAETDVKDSLKSVNIGLIGGGGVMHRLGPGDLILEAHFQLGLSTIQKDVTTSGNNQTGAVVVSLGYSLPLPRGK
jgi:hypothetical protein